MKLLSFFLELPDFENLAVLILNLNVHLSAYARYLIPDSPPFSSDEKINSPIYFFKVT
jgi:hypothetical protein